MPPAVLVTDGWYVQTRHPILFGVMAIILGEDSFFSSVALLGYALHTGCDCPRLSWCPIRRVLPRRASLDSAVFSNLTIVTEQCSLNRPSGHPSAIAGTCLTATT